jgi:hypothetical protein
LKMELCKAFCSELHFREVPAGLAVSTAFDVGPEPLGFYIVGPDMLGRFRIEDDGTTVPLIEAEGADRTSQTRTEAFAEMLAEYGADYNEERGELVSPSLQQNQIPQAALKFVALLLRLQDMVLLTPERALSTFREDASNAIREALGDRAEIRENEPIAPGIEFPADLILKAKGRAPVAIFLAMTEQRVLEAVIVQLAALYEARFPCSVIALLEKESAITRKMQTHAANRLSALPTFRGEEHIAISRIEREVLGFEGVLH